MERESFESQAVADVLNRYFVSIKVDREERPDLDEVYMAATVALSGSGGWPMSVFLMSDQRPFFAGTYFPPTDRPGRPGFVTMLLQVAELWTTRRDDLGREAEALSAHVRKGFEHEPPRPVSHEAIENAVKALGRAFDPNHGGFGSAPKFPPCTALSLLLRHHATTGDVVALTMVRRTLDAMKDGGIYDQLAGGFARYSTDERWLVPHFEKMLYDNAGLAAVYLEAFQVTAEPEYERVARETLDYVMREMQGPEGGYFSATDADSEGVEGKFFVFSLDEVQAVLERDAAEYFSYFYDVSAEGNWEGHSILHRPHRLDDAAKTLGLSPAELSASLDRVRAAAELAALRGRSAEILGESGVDAAAKVSADLELEVSDLRRDFEALRADLVDEEARWKAVAEVEAVR